MNNGKGTHGQARDPELPDEDVGADELRAAAERAWRNRWGIPGGTPEQDTRSADRVGGDRPARPDDADDVPDKKKV